MSDDLEAAHPHSWWNRNLEFGFRRKGKTEAPDKKASHSKRENQPQTQPTNVTKMLGFEPGSHWWKASGSHNSARGDPCSSRIKIYGHCGNVYLGLCISILPLNIDGPNNVLN